MQQAIQFLSLKDSILKSIIKTYGNPVIQKRNEGFASMCHIILEQQVSIASAKACYTKIENQFQQINPKIIITATDEELKK